METKKCLDCKEEKPLTEFYSHIEKKRKGALRFSSYCKKCEIKRSTKINQLPGKRKLYNNNRRLKKFNNPEYKEEVNRKQRERSRNNPVSKLLYAAKSRSKKYNIEFNLTKEDIIIPQECPILKVKFITGTKGNYWFTPSLDRIDNTKGYIKGNISIISMLANVMKNAASVEQLLVFSENIKEYLLKNKDIVRTIKNVEFIELKDKEPLR